MRAVFLPSCPPPNFNLGTFTWYSCNGQLKRRRRQRERQKGIGRDFRQNNNFARASRFLYITLHDHDVKLSNYTFSGGREHQKTILLVGRFDKLNDME